MTSNAYLKLFFIKKAFLVSPCQELSGFFFSFGVCVKCSSNSLVAVSYSSELCSDLVLGVYIS